MGVAGEWICKKQLDSPVMPFGLHFGPGAVNHGHDTHVHMVLQVMFAKHKEWHW